MPGQKNETNAVNGVYTEIQEKLGLGVDTRTAVWVSAAEKITLCQSENLRENSEMFSKVWGGLSASSA